MIQIRMMATEYLHFCDREVTFDRIHQVIRRLQRSDSPICYGSGLSCYMSSRGLSSVLRFSVFFSSSPFRRHFLCCQEKMHSCAHDVTR
jgi:hypothetical protein